MTKSMKDPRVYLEDILSAIARIAEYTAEGKQAFFKDQKTQDAVIRQISIIGEAAAKLPASVKTKHARIPWRRIIGMRNIVIHDYSQTDLPTVWVVAEHDLPALKRTVESMLEEKGA